MPNKVKKYFRKSYTYTYTHVSGTEHSFTKTSIALGIIKLEHWELVHSGEEEQLHLM